LQAQRAILMHIGFPALQGMNAIRRHSYGRVARRSPAQALLIAFTVFSFVLQSLATQTHIHPSGSGGISWTFGIADRTSPVVPQAGKSNNNPAQDDLTHCAFCDAIAHAGAFVASAPALLVLPSQTFSVIPLELAVPAYVDAASHFWRGRAPPRV
jgi:hypothetical protein